jgi:hypothetical protein
LKRDFVSQGVIWIETRERSEKTGKKTISVVSLVSPSFFVRSGWATPHPKEPIKLEKTALTIPHGQS